MNCFEHLTTQGEHHSFSFLRSTLRHSRPHLPLKSPTAASTTHFWRRGGVVFDMDVENDEIRVGYHRPPIRVLVSDVWVLILEHLTTLEAGNLIRIGNPALSSIVVQNWRKFVWGFECGSKFPFAALHLPQLRSFVIDCATFETRYIYVGPDGLSSPTVRHNCLRTIKFDFRQSGTLLHGCTAALPLSSRFPSLTTLKLRGLRADASLIARLAHLGETLQTLVFDVPRSGTIVPDLELVEVMSRLPRSLTKLTLMWPRMRISSTLLACWPPLLRTLNLQKVSQEVIFQLPTTLKSATLSIFGDEELAKWPLSTFPPALTHLSLVHEFSPHIQFEYDAAWPPHLTTLDVSIPADTPLKQLPTTLKSLSHQFRPTHLGSELFAQFPSLTTCTLTTDVRVEAIPATLTDLRLQRTVTFQSPLPSHIRRFSTLAFREDMKQLLPAQLEALSVRGWDSPHLPPTDLIRTLRFPAALKKLEIALNRTHYAGLTHLAELKSLDTLECRGAAPSHCRNPSAPFLIGCLPPSLTSMFIAFDAVPGDSVDPVWLQRLDLASAVPQLRALGLTGGFSNSSPLGPALATLPARLQSLWLLRCRSIPEASACAHLPPALLGLEISFELAEESSEDGELTNEHFSGLPPLLVHLVARIPIKSRITRDIVTFLPRHLNITYFYRADYHAHPEINEALNAHFNSLPQFHGYL